MSAKLFARTLFPASLLLFLSALPSLAGTCLNSGCHQALTKYKYLHGPVAAEQSDSPMGCTSCHKSTGAPCTKTAKGAFVLAETKEKLCHVCHEKGDSPNHADRITTVCTKCHSPHGSDKNAALTRF